MAESNNNLEKKWQDFEKTGNPAVDMVADHIRMYRRCFKPVKCITLSPNAYGRFISWVRDQMKDEYKSGVTYTFDGVNIEKGTSLMIKDLYVEFYPMPKVTA